MRYELEEKKTEIDRRDGVLKRVCCQNSFSSSSPLNFILSALTLFNLGFLRVEEVKINTNINKKGRFNKV